MKSFAELNATCTPAQSIHNFQKTLASTTGGETIAAEAPTTRLGRTVKALRQGAADGFSFGASLTDKARAGTAVKNSALTPVASAIPGIAAGVVLPYAGNVATFGVSPLAQLACGDGMPAAYSSNKGIKAGAWNAFSAIKEYGVLGLPELAFDAIAAHAKINWVKQGASALSMVAGFVPGVVRSATALGALVVFNVAPAVAFAILGSLYKVGELALSPSKIKEKAPSSDPELVDAVVKGLSTEAIVDGVQGERAATPVPDATIAVVDETPAESAVETKDEQAAA